LDVLKLSLKDELVLKDSLNELDVLKLSLKDELVLKDSLKLLDVLKLSLKDELVLKDSLNELDVLKLRSEEHTSELQSRFDLVCRLLLQQEIRMYKIVVNV